MKMKTNSLLSLCVALSAISVTSTSMQASTTDSRIESSAKKSYVFKTYLKDDSIKVDSKDGVVTLTGTVSKESEKALAEDTMACRASRAWTIN
jgi:hyperosmotically inducible periplasmic protein